MHHSKRMMLKYSNHRRLHMPLILRLDAVFQHQKRALFLNAFRHKKVRKFRMYLAIAAVMCPQNRRQKPVGSSHLKDFPEKIRFNRFFLSFATKFIFRVKCFGSIIINRFVWKGIGSKKADVNGKTIKYDVESTDVSTCTVSNARF